MRAAPAGRLIELDAPGAAATLAPRAAAQRVSAALAAEPGAVLLRPTPRGQAILAELPAGVPVIAILPDMTQLLRDVAERGALTAVLGRLGRGGLAAWPRLAATGMRHVLAAARQDFGGIVPVLLELERAGLGRAKLQGVALATPLTDLLLAAGNGDCLGRIVRFVQRRFRVPAGLETANLGHLLPRLGAWGVAPDFVVGPLNARGFRMKPTPAAVLAAVRASSTPVLASEVSAGGTLALGPAVAHARAHGAAGVIVTLDDLATDATPG